MSNSYFQFKQFRIEQDKCAMKVTTDACIQGAWTPVLPEVKRALDIGAGNGLLSLMLAQRNHDITIDALELDEAAGAQAMQNVQASPWKDRINVVEGDARSIRFHQKYDLIISNPPFFINSLLGDKETRNNARHMLSLTQVDLLNVIAHNLKDDGYASILLPNTEYAQWTELARSKGWNEAHRLEIRHRPGAEIKRVVGLFNKNQQTAPTICTLVIRGERDNYTPEFMDLLGPFYLHF